MTVSNSAPAGKFLSARSLCLSVNWFEFICLAVILFLIVPANTRGDVIIDKIKYEPHDSDKTATVAGYFGVPILADIPSTRDNDGKSYTVGAIRSGAFGDCTTLNSLSAFLLKILTNRFGGSTIPVAFCIEKAFLV